MMPRPLALYLATVLTASAADSVVVFNEIHYHPANEAVETEWVELRSLHGVDVDISGWRIDGGIDFTIPSGTIVSGHTYRVVAANPGLLAVPSLGPFTGQLSNAGEPLRLRNRLGRVMDEVEYADGGDWPAGPDGGGVTLARRSYGAASGPSAWAGSLQPGGTPGAKNFATAGDPPTTSTLIPLNAVWKYQDTGIAPPADWATPGFDDTSWPSGGAVLHAGNPNLNGAGEGLLGYWPLNQSTGTTAANLAPGGTVGSLFPGASWVNDPARGQVLALDGVDGYVSAGTLPRMTLTNDFTWAFWAYSTQASGNVVVGNRVSPSGFDWVPREFIKFTPQTFQFDYNNVQHVDYADMPNAVWVHHALVKQGANLTYYRDGAVAVTRTIGAGQNNPQPLYFGGDKLAENWQGRLDDVAIWAKALPAASALGLANGTYTPLTAPTGGSSATPVTPVAAGPGPHYFRKAFAFSGALARTSLQLQHVLDDGAVVYLNGSEVLRVNLPAGALTPASSAFTNITASPISAWLDLPGGALVSGTNVLAVAVHQHPANTDLAFAAALRANEAPLVPGPTLVFHELSSAADPSFHLELRNDSASALDTAGWVIRTSDGDAFNLPTHSQAPGGIASFTAASLGLVPSDGLRLLLFAPGGMEYADSREITGRLRGLTPDGRWGYPSSSTPGTANTFALSDAIVINEIFYNAPAPAAPTPPSGEQWVELHNRGATPVDLSLWSFSSGIEFTFPSNTPALPAGGYAVVAWNPATFAALHPGVTALGPFSGSLSGKGETLTLRDANGNVADEVSYFDGGRWSAWADGGGSSLELIDPDADNARGEAWEASDESDQSTWQSVNYSGPATLNPGNNPTTWNEFLFGLLNAGEFLIDDIVVTDTTQGTGNLIQNGTFSNGSNTFWRLIGTHSGTVVDDPVNPGNPVLKVSASAETEHMHNHCGTTLKNGANYHSIVSTDTYSISFRAKWLRGSNALHSRLYVNRLPRKTLLNRPTTGGTPGSQNSRYAANLGPTFDALSHFPAVPAAGQTAQVRVRVGDPDGLATVELFTSVDGGAFTSVPMSLGLDGFHTASFAGQAAGAIGQFYVRATDGAGAVSLFPAGGPAARALIPWADGRAQLTLASGAQPHNLRVVLTGADANALYRHENLMSNGSIPCTVILDEQHVYYRAGVALKSSEHGRFNINRVGYNLEFSPDDLFLGTHGGISVDRSGGVVTGQKEILVKTLSNLAGGIHAPEDDLIRLIPARASGTGFQFDGAGMLGAAILSKTRLKRDYLDNQWDNGGDGMMFKYERVYVLTQTINPTTRVVDPAIVPENPKIPQDSTAPPGVGVTSLGVDPEVYRWHWLVESGRDTDDYSGIMNVTAAIGQAGGSVAFNTQVAQHINVDACLRAHVPAILYGVIDNYLASGGAGAQHNVLFYFPPGEKAVIFPWDMDFLSQANPTTTSIANGGDVAKFIANPVWKRMYYGHMLDVLNRSFNTPTMTRWAAHYSRFGTDDMNASVTSYLTPRANYARDVITGANGQTAPIPQVAFARASASPVTVATPFATVSGDGWINIAEIRLQGAGEPLAVTWTDDNSWSLQVPAYTGTRTNTLVAFDSAGASLGTTSVVITGTGAVSPAGPGDLVVSEIHFNPSGAADTTEFLEILSLAATSVDLSGCHFDEELGQGITYLFPSTPPLAPGGRLVIARDRTSFLAAYPAAAAQLAPGQFDPSSLDNGGERLVLYSDAGQVIFDFNYDDGLNPTDGAGRSLVRVLRSTAPNGTSLVWRASTADGGNPGTSDALAFTGVVDADADADGIPALLEYALGTSDASFDPSPFTLVSHSSGRLIVSFNRRTNADDAELFIEASTTLPGPWALADATKTDDTTVGTLRAEAWTIVPPPGTDRFYVRLKATSRLP